MASLFRDAREAMTTEQQEAFQSSATGAMAWSAAEHARQKEGLAAGFAEQGLRSIA